MELLKSNSRLGSLIILLDMVHIRDESLQDWLGDVNLWNNLSFSLYAASSVCYVVTILDKRKKSEIKVSTDWYIAIKHQRLSSIKVIFVNYQTNKL